MRLSALKPVRNPSIGLKESPPHEAEHGGGKTKGMGT